tara:strand:- start:129 stop:812 length:684 start_codon:yes stop_codon:yes gene_type:complete
MSSELIEVMDFPRENLDYFEIMADNVFNKKTESSKKKTINYLTQLYSFKKEDKKFLSLESYWNKIEDNEKPLLAILLAVSKDYLLEESVDLVKSTKSNNKASKEEFESNIDHYHPNRFSPKTLSAVSRNIVSSWKQAGYILGKMKNIRTVNPPSYFAVAFAFLIAYIDGLRGDYLFDHPSVKALDASKEEITTLIKAASDRELLDFNRSGVSLVISFEKYLKTLNDV